jgi:XTP/dITP diphosphohydrolase
MKIVLATRNKGKAREIKEILKNLKLEILTLDDFPEIPIPAEDGKSFHENTLIKARFIAQCLHVPFTSP